MKETTLDNNADLSGIIETIKDLTAEVEIKPKRQQGQYFSGYAMIKRCMVSLPKDL